MSAAAPLVCPACGAPYAAGDRFCADCGARLGAAPMPACANCGGTGFDADGFCTDCGARSRGSTAGLVVLGPGLAAVTDPGQQHRENQDAVELSGPSEGRAGVVAVVCDGVSHSQTPAAAASVAAQAAAAALRAAGGMALGAAGGRVSAAAMRDAVMAAHAAVCALPYDRQADVDPPACTLVAACVQRDGDELAVVLGWLGDSRAYLVVDGGPVLLTHDHSWVNQVVDAGRMPLADAMRDRRAHALVNCLGTTNFAAASPCPEPSVRTVSVPAADLRGAGWLLLCTDGLWNYADSPGALLRACPGMRGMEAGAVCSALLQHALDGGGHDNVTVVAIGL
ncbi:MAG: protein phosphatase 2C domain-containing protein [Janthinobacterium lividum]